MISNTEAVRVRTDKANFLDQLNFSSILQKDFLGHLKLASLPSEVVRFW